MSALKRWIKENEIKSISLITDEEGSVHISYEMDDITGSFQDTVPCLCVTSDGTEFEADLPHLMTLRYLERN